MRTCADWPLGQMIKNVGRLPGLEAITARCLLYPTLGWHWAVLIGKMIDFEGNHWQVEWGCFRTGWGAKAGSNARELAHTLTIIPWKFNSEKSWHPLLESCKTSWVQWYPVTNSSHNVNVWNLVQAAPAQWDNKAVVSDQLSQKHFPTCGFCNTQCNTVPTRCRLFSLRQRSTMSSNHQVQ